MTEFNPEREKIHAIPKIAELLLDGAPLQDIVQQIFADYYHSPVQDKEKLELGLLAIAQRGVEAMGAIQWMAQDSGEIGEIAKQVLELPKPHGITQDDIERILKINRFPKTVDVTAPSTKITGTFYEYAIEMGMVPPNTSISEFVDRMLASEAALTGSPKYKHDHADQESLVVTSTFGVSDSDFLDLLGVQHILRMRRNGGNALLLGSLGARSAREFAVMNRKISKNITSHVIDIDPNFTKDFTERDHAAGIRPIQGSALELPYADDSMDTIFTNHLLHHLVLQPNEGHVGSNPTVLNTLLKEARRVLKPGGRIVMEERPFFTAGKTSSTSDEFERAKQLIKSQALQAGLIPKVLSSNSRGYVFRRDANGASISSNGLPSTSKLLQLVKGQYYGIVLEK